MNGCGCEQENSNPVADENEGLNSTSVIKQGHVRIFFNYSDAGVEQS